jgi:hypothetical protein
MVMGTLHHIHLIGTHIFLVDKETIFGAFKPKQTIVKLVVSFFKCKGQKYVFGLYG